MEKKPVSHFQVGIIISLVNIVFFLAFYFTGKSFEKGFLSWIPMIVFCGILIYSIIQFAKANDGNVTFSSCFSYGFKATAIIALIMFAFLLCFLLLTPEYKANFLDFMQAQMEQNQSATPDQQEVGLKFIEKFFMITILGGSVFGNLVGGAIASLIGAAIAKKNPIDPFVQ